MCDGSEDERLEKLVFGMDRMMEAIADWKVWRVEVESRVHGLEELVSRMFIMSDG